MKCAQFVSVASCRVLMFALVTHCEIGRLYQCSLLSLKFIVSCILLNFFSLSLLYFFNSYCVPFSMLFDGV